MSVVTALSVITVGVRLTRLVTADRLFAPLRGRLEPTRLGYLIACPWCLSIWFGAAVTALAEVVPSSTVRFAGMVALISLASGAFQSLENLVEAKAELADGQAELAQWRTALIRRDWQ